MSRPAAPYQSAPICFVGQDFVDRCSSPSLTITSRQHIFIQYFGDILATGPSQCHFEYSTHHLYSNGSLRLRFQFVSSLAPINNRYLCHTIGWSTTTVIAPFSIFSQ